MTMDYLCSSSSFQRKLESRRGDRGVKGWQGLTDARVRLSFLLSFPLRGNGLLHHWIPACAGMTKGAKVRNLSGMAKKLSGCRQTYPDPRRHSSEGWNPGGEAGE